MKYNKGDTVCIKKTKEVGEIVEVSEFVKMYRVNTGTQCIWVDDNEIEEVNKND